MPNICSQAVHAYIYIYACVWFITVCNCYVIFCFYDILYLSIIYIIEEACHFVNLLPSAVNIIMAGNV